MTKILDDADISNAIASRESFNCPSCLINPQKADLEVVAVMEMQSLMQSANQLLRICNSTPQMTEPSNKKKQSNIVEIEDVIDEQDNHTEPVEKEPTIILGGFQGFLPPGSNNEQCTQTGNNRGSINHPCIFEAFIRHPINILHSTLEA